MRARYQFEMLGYNFRMTDLAAAIGLAQLGQAASATPPGGRRSPPATTRRSASCRSACRSRPTAGPTSSTSTRSTSGGARDAIVADLREAGVGADIYYPIPVHRQAYIMERGLHADLPVTDAAAARTLALPMYPGPDRRGAGRRSIDAVRGRRRAPPPGPTAARPRPRSRRPMTDAWRPAGDARAAGRPRRSRVDGPQPPPDPLEPAGRPLAAVADPVADALAARDRAGRAPRASPSRWR